MLTSYTSQNKHTDVVLTLHFTKKSMKTLRNAKVDKL